MQENQPKSKICEQCRKEYLPTRGNSRFCCAECGVAYRAAKRLPQQEKKCEGCGNIFITSRSWSKFCSNRCRNAHHNAIHREARKS